MTFPRRRYGRRLLVLAAMLALASMGRVAHAQFTMYRPALNPRGIDATSMGAPVQLGSVWLAHRGDDPQWSQPGFDDSHWQVFNTSLAPVQQGMKNVDAIWYRTHVRIPADAHDLALLITTVAGSNEFFVNGRRVAGWGSFAPGGANMFVNQLIAPIPDSALASGQLTIAVRSRAGKFSHHGDFAADGITALSRIWLGPAHAVSDLNELTSFRNYTSNATNLTLVLVVLLITLALAFTVRNEPEYAVLAAALAAQAAQQIESLWILLHNLPTTFWTLLLQDGLQLFGTVALIEFVRIVLGLRRSRWFTAYYAALLLGLAVSLFSTLYWTPRHALDHPVTVALHVFLQFVTMPAEMGLPLLALWVGWRKRNRDAWLLSVPLLVNASLAYYLFGAYLLYLAHAVSATTLALANYVPIRAFTVGWNEVVSFAFSITLLIFIVVRTIRLAREKARAASEMQAVKTLQGLLLARCQQPTPGYAVETVYRPASEVGGDFFLVSPHPDGAIVAIVGDVSGKGLLAAMRVSLILGALNRETSRTPAEVLSRLNQVLLGQGDMGFTTACCVRLEANGDYSFANAGHLNPYIDGQEIEAPGVLPLGLKADAAYSTVTGHLNPGQRLVLLSDGVPEARAKRELLGFDKLVELTRLGAAEIADAAQNFGQEDDITVLAVALA